MAVINNSINSPSVATTFTLDTGTNNLSISNDASATTVAIGTGAAAKSVTLGSLNTTSTTTINAGTSGLSLATGTTGNIAINPGTSGAVTLGTTSTGNVSVGNTTGTTSIQFGAGAALNNFTNWTSWTPTAVGGGTAGTTTYTVQLGTYMRLGNFVIAHFSIAASAATGTGALVIGGLPVAVVTIAQYNPYAAGIVTGLAFPTNATFIQLTAIGGTSTAQFNTVIPTSGVSSFLQIANAAFTTSGTLIYRVV